MILSRRASQTHKVDNFQLKTACVAFCVASAVCLIFQIAITAMLGNLDLNADGDGEPMEEDDGGDAVEEDNGDEEDVNMEED